ncbi:winged helix-turn-helix domain-containing protein [Streptomyces sp. MS2.AVA.5]|uniref:Winged helix-turn-helix domain-containing protein n=1 Tax=Streptomyces achmelvichensis TaxID=3134111 RepID=A0ACC6PL41_9ACTN
MTRSSQMIESLPNSERFTPPRPRTSRQDRSLRGISRDLDLAPLRRPPIRPNFGRRHAVGQSHPATHPAGRLQALPHERFTQGCRNASPLFREVRDQGSRGERAGVNRYIRQLKQGIETAPQAPALPKPRRGTALGDDAPRPPSTTRSPRTQDGPGRLPWARQARRARPSLRRPPARPTRPGPLRLDRTRPQQRPAIATAPQNLTTSPSQDQRQSPLRSTPTVTGVALSRASVWRLLTGRLGWSLQRPERRAVERNESEIARWIAHEWPRGGGEHTRLDRLPRRSDVSLLPQIRRTYAPRGLTPCGTGSTGARLDGCGSWLSRRRPCHRGPWLCFHLKPRSYDTARSSKSWNSSRCSTAGNGWTSLPATRGCQSVLRMRFSTATWPSDADHATGSTNSAHPSAKTRHAPRNGTSRRAHILIMIAAGSHAKAGQYLRCTSFLYDGGAASGNRWPNGWSEGRLTI